MMENVFNILEERGYIEQMTHPKEIKELFGKESVPFYIGIDPTADSLHEELLTIPEVVKQKTQEDGNFEIKVIPGEYDLLINKQGYIDYIHIQITLQESQIKQLGQIELIAGDVNKDGVVEILDKVLITKQNGTNSSSPDFSVECDLNDDGKVEILDKTIVTKNNGQRRKIINEKGGNT